MIVVTPAHSITFHSTVMFHFFFILIVCLLANSIYMHRVFHMEYVNGFSEIHHISVKS